MPTTKRVTVDDAPTNATIQQVVDEVAAAGGGVVEVPAGVYAMHDALQLRSGVRVVGEAGVVLRKVPSVSSTIPDHLGYGHYEITVDEPDKFRVGMGVHVLDDGGRGFYTTVASIIGKEGDRLFIDRMLNHDCSPGQNAIAVSVYPIVEAAGVSDAGVEGVAVDGNQDEETFTLNGCRGGGVFAIRSHRLTVRGVEVMNYRRDGISFQQCTDVLVEDCHVHHNTGGGLHPGSGTVRYVMRRNRVHDNGGCGIYYCLRTTHSICCDNTIADNAEAGISIGTRDTDHIVSGNTISGNGGPGIQFRGFTRQGGDRVRVEGNTVGPNCAGEAEHEIEIRSGVCGVHVVGNTIQPGKGAAFGVGDGCEQVCIEGNTVAGRPQEPGDVAGEPDGIAFTDAIGPAGLPLDGARHLNIPQLAAWEDFGVEDA